MGPRANSQRGRVLAVVMETPSTSPEVAAETGLPVKHCCAHLRSLWQDGFLTRQLMAPQEWRPGRMGRAPWLYTVKPAVQTGPKMTVPASFRHESGELRNETHGK